MTHLASAAEVAVWAVGACTVDLKRQLLLRDGAPVALRPKAWTLLTTLLQRPNAVFSSAELAHALWPRQDIDPKQLVNTISELRGVLGGAGTLRSLHRRGFLLVAEPAAHDMARSFSALPQRPALVRAPAHFFGREVELQALRGSLQRALDQGCQCVEISGVSGVGKSTLLAQWLTGLALGGEWTVLACRALESAGDMEPFGPLIQMLADHCQVVGALRVADDLQRLAPCWLAQLPTLTSPAQLAQLQQEVYRSGEGRMRREGVELIRHWAGERPVILVLEDVQWADAATLDVLSALAQRALQQRLVIVTTRRVDPRVPAPADQSSPRGVIQHLLPGHVLRLTVHGFGLSEARAYLRVHLPELVVRDDQVLQLLQLTEGLPLFLKTVVDAARAGSLAEPGGFAEPLQESLVPQLRHVIVDRVASLGVDLRALVDLACCIAEPVVVPVLALTLEIPEPVVGERCQHLVQTGLFACHPTLVPWQGQRLVKAYGVAHALYREALFAELSTSLLLVMSVRIASALREVSLATQGLMSRLTPLYARVGLHEEAAAAMRLSGLRSLGRFSTRHAVRALQTSLSELQQVPNRGSTLPMQLETLWDLSRVMLIEYGASDARVEAVRARIDALAPEVGTNRARFLQQATCCARFVYGGRADLAQQPAMQLREISAGLGDHERALAQLWLGNVATAHGHLDDAAAAFGSCLALPLTGLGLAGLDARAIAITQMAWLQAMTGQIPDFAARLHTLEAEVHTTRSVYLRVVASFWMADALRQLGCTGPARRRYAELLELCVLYDSAAFRDQAQMGLLACDSPAQRNVPALLAMASHTRGANPTWSDHMLSMAALEGQIAQGQLDEARAMLRCCAALDQHWPLYMPERLRLAGDLERALGQTDRAQALWARALAMDLERGCLPGILRHLQRQPLTCANMQEGAAPARLQQLLAPLGRTDLGHPDLVPLEATRRLLPVGLHRSD